jgi:hypothetical protein
LPPHILAIKEAGKNMVGKNITEILEQANRRNSPDCTAISGFRTDAK